MQKTKHALREANMGEAAARAQSNSHDRRVSIKADSLAVMEDAMVYIYRWRLRKEIATKMRT